MKIQTEQYTIESSDNFGFRLTVAIPSDHPKSKSGVRTVQTFHADLKQVAAKMVSYEVMHADAKDVFALADVVDAASKRLAAALEGAE